MAEPVLALFERNIWRRKSVFDSTQVAADGATVSFYGQGATVSVGEYLPANDPTPVTLLLYDCGDIVSGDFVQQGANASAVLRVVGAEGRDKVNVVNTSASNISVSANDRLVKLNDRPSVYADPRGMRSLSSEVTISKGRLSVYIAATRFDYIVSGAGVSTAPYRDAMGGSNPNPSWVAVLDHGLDLQASIDALPSTGGEIFLPAGTYVLPSTLVLNKDNVSLRGQGSNTIITGPANPSFDLVRIERRFCRLQDMQIDGNATIAAPGKSCLVVNGQPAQQVFLKNLLLNKASKHGLEVHGAGQVFGFNCQSSDNLGGGFDLRGDGFALLVRLVSCTASGNGTMGVFMDAPAATASGVTLLGCVLDGGVEASALCGLQLIGCRLRWTGMGAGPPQLLKAVEVRGLVVEGCWFDGQVGAQNQALLAAYLQSCFGGAFVGNIGSHFANGFLVFELCGWAVEMSNKDLDSPAAPRISAVGSTLFGLSKGVVEPFGYTVTPPTDNTWRQGTMFWDNVGLRVVVDDIGTLKRVSLQGL